MQHIEKTIKTLFSLFEKHGSDAYFGEPVTQLQHACQAAEYARTEGYDDEVIIAAFLHDIGHLCEEANTENSMENLGILDHEVVGAKYLSELGFSEKICQLIASHVAAKRYLTFKNPVYYQNLSEASKQTLTYQGGVMSEQEAAAFESDPLSILYIQMRLWDEKAKIADAPLPDLGFYKDLIRKHLSLPMLSF
jgi:2-amino-1-hydroxyethylphosphonate dioxygenase (glycine-forming)